MYRYDDSGRLDHRFGGGDGEVIVRTGQNAAGQGLATAPGGRIFVFTRGPDGELFQSHTLFAYTPPQFVHRCDTPHADPEK